MMIENGTDRLNESISVLMLAYRHGPYIRQAIASVLNQQCERTVRLWIGEDNSPDDTRAVCRELQAAHPEKIELLCSDQSLGMHGNFSTLWKKSAGEFVAFCEGDDYWSDPLKLQKQLDFFEAHPECSLCGTFTDVLAGSPDGEWRVVRQVRPPIIKETYTFQEMIPSYGFHFSSVMLRRDAVQFPEWFETTYCVDRPLYLLAAQNGPVGLIPEVTSVYRLHDGGAWSTLNARDKADKSIHLFTQMNEHFAPRHAPLFKDALGAILWSYVGMALQQGDRKGARSVYRDALQYLPLSHCIRNLRHHLGVVARLLFPGVGKNVEQAVLERGLR